MRICVPIALCRQQVQNIDSKIKKKALYIAHFILRRFDRTARLG